MTDHAIHKVHCKEGMPASWLCEITCSVSVRFWADVCYFTYNLSFIPVTKSYVDEIQEHMTFIYVIEI